VVGAHICSAAMAFFGMTSLDDDPSSEYFPESSSDLTPEQGWQVLDMGVRELVLKFVDISYPAAGKKMRDCVHAYAKEVLSLGLLYKKFCDGIREGDGERIIKMLALSN
jgi:L1 cell adhesion molecule like protein